MDSFLRLPSVVARTGLSRSSIYAAIVAGTFPKQISLGARAVGWIESEIGEWIDARIALRDLPLATPTRSHTPSTPPQQPEHVSRVIERVVDSLKQKGVA